MFWPLRVKEQLFPVSTLVLGKNISNASTCRHRYRPARTRCRGLDPGFSRRVASVPVSLFMPEVGTWGWDVCSGWGHLGRFICYLIHSTVLHDDHKCPEHAWALIAAGPVWALARQFSNTLGSVSRWPAVSVSRGGVFLGLRHRVTWGSSRPVPSSRKTAECPALVSCWLVDIFLKHNRLDFFLTLFDFSLQIGKSRR